jgi:ATP-dependent RNA helicase RhlE
MFKKQAGPRRPNTTRSNYGKPRRFSRGRSRGHEVRIDVTKFINKTVITEKTEVFVPEHTFADFKLNALIKKNITAKGYEIPTPIQDRAIPHLLRGEDIVGIANTGTGKTAAFLIPVIEKIMKDPTHKALVLVPTRELADQIDEELRDFAKGSNLYSVLCIGGASISQQMRELSHPFQFVVGTPGRIMDLIRNKRLDLSKFQTVVLDEADRMLDMGFIADIRSMMKMVPKERHTLFFSATISSKIEGLISEFLNNPVRISVKTEDTSKNVHQDVVRISQGEKKIDVLEKLLKGEEFRKVLVFGRTKHGVEKLAKELIQKGFKAESIHGNKNQSQRQRSLDMFKNDRAQVLTATDVAARGLDISGVTHVINFDIPATYEDYVHRIGRTGRGGKSGKALTFVE